MTEGNYFHRMPFPLPFFRFRSTLNANVRPSCSSSTLEENATSGASQMGSWDQSCGFGNPIQLPENEGFT